jgi:hypothetical protein
MIIIFIIIIAIVMINSNFHNVMMCDNDASDIGSSVSAAAALGST